MAAVVDAEPPLDVHRRLLVAWARLLGLLRAAHVEWLAVLMGLSQASGSAFLLLGPPAFGTVAGFAPIARHVTQPEWGAAWLAGGLLLSAWPWLGPRLRLVAALGSACHWGFTVAAFAYATGGRSFLACLLWPCLLGCLVLIARSGDTAPPVNRGADGHDARAG